MERNAFGVDSAKRIRPAVSLVHWLFTGSARLFPYQILYDLFGVFFMHNVGKTTT